ncbi:S41 family peptidase [Roseateles cellulosilyticus]|uniref:S41 family peptidase n=1 Tax=Pelomonas cellulosilytica TaxID=2906762 RepID=A0ABS8XZ08_9BURK|nr:S41 family peptidase [Pelomonas sp. P8]MCE4557854.1 S41 family peptidase [Pelomonas sp. P8]
MKNSVGGAARSWRARMGGGLGLLLVISGFGGCGGHTTNRQSESRPMTRDGHFDERLIGTWRVLGAGALLEITRDGMTQFQQGTSVCYPDELASTSDPADLASMSFVDNGDGETVDLFELVATPSSATLARIASIPPSCRAKPATDGTATLGALCDLMAQDYAFFAERKIDWATRCNQLAPRAAAARDDDALQLVLIALLQGLNDAHVKLSRGHGEERRQVFSAADSPTRRLLAQAFGGQTEINDLREFQQAWRDEVQKQAIQRLTNTGGPLLNGALRWGRLPGNVGYVSITSMHGFSDDPSPAAETRMAREAMDRVIADLADTRALILDVSLNGGGLDAVSAEITGSFADQRRLAFIKKQHRPQGRPAQSWFIEPKGATQYRKPVYVLTSDLSASAAETFTLMMRQLPQVVHAGQATAGSISDVLDKPLPGNFSISFSNEIDLDPSGQLFEVTGIPPQLSLPMFRPGAPETLLTGHRAAIDALIAIATR